jgi:hypothetical protein
MKNKLVKYASATSETFIFNRMQSEKANGYIKKGVFTNEIVWGNYSYIFSKLDRKKQTAFRKGMFLFGMVRRDSKIFLQKNTKIKLPKKYGQIDYIGSLNEDLLGKVTGTDLNHAYWRIAYNLGIISEHTYMKGLKDEFKSVRLASLSTLGKEKKYQKIKNGEIIDEYLIIGGEEELKSIYILIRYTCYKYMNEVKKLLGKDFLCYKTDCIYYIDNKENRKKVKDFFNQKNLLMKQLE